MERCIGNGTVFSGLTDDRGEAKFSWEDLEITKAEFSITHLRGGEVIKKQEGVKLAKQTLLWRYQNTSLLRFQGSFLKRLDRK